MTSLTVHPHAKINLGLKVLGPRSDGYHNILTRFQTVDLRDEIEIVACPSPSRLSLSVEGADLAADGTNLVLKAAEALRQMAARRMGATLRLRKGIPLAAGLGGGSSDAAATLLGLNQLWEVGLSARELARLGSTLGADVPFFMTGGTAWGRGRGDEIEPLPDLPQSWVCLVLPPVMVSTRDAYRSLPHRGRATAPSAFSIESAMSPAREETMINDFQEIIVKRHPELEDYLRRLRASGARGTSLSGSGPALFGLFDEEHVALSVSRSWDWAATRIHVCRTVGRLEYQARLGARFL